MIKYSKVTEPDIPLVLVLTFVVVFGSYTSNAALPSTFSKSVSADGNSTSTVDALVSLKLMRLLRSPMRPKLPLRMLIFRIPYSKSILAVSLALLVYPTNIGRLVLPVIVRLRHISASQVCGAMIKIAENVKFLMRLPYSKIIVRC